MWAPVEPTPPGTEGMGTLSSWSGGLGGLSDAQGGGGEALLQALLDTSVLQPPQ